MHVELHVHVAWDNLSIGMELIQMSTVVTSLLFIPKDNQLSACNTHTGACAD